LNQLLIPNGGFKDASYKNMVTSKNILHEKFYSISKISKVQYLVQQF